jgi:heme-degrading monooxygenase HmoA
MAKVFTHGRWTVVPGREDDFVRVWSDLARRASDLPGAEPPTLLRDRDRPNLFLTFGAWSDLAAVDAFRGSDLFKEAVEATGSLVERFEPMTLDQIEWG